MGQWKYQNLGVPLQQCALVMIDISQCQDWWVNTVFSSAHQEQPINQLGFSLHEPWWGLLRRQTAPFQWNEWQEATHQGPVVLNCHLVGERRIAQRHVQHKHSICSVWRALHPLLSAFFVNHQKNISNQQSLVVWTQCTVLQKMTKQMTNQGTTKDNSGEME